MPAVTVRLGAATASPLIPTPPLRPRERRTPPPADARSAPESSSAPATPLPDPDCHSRRWRRPTTPSVPVRPLAPASCFWAPLSYLTRTLGCALPGLICPPSSRHLASAADRCERLLELLHVCTLGEKKVYHPHEA